MAKNRVQIFQDQLRHPEALTRPIITNINGDVSWLVSFPRPSSEKGKNTKTYYHVVIDPWFGAPSIFFSSLVLEMGLGRDPALPNRTAIDTTISEIELAAGNPLLPADIERAIDAIFIIGTAEHCHKESLLQFSPSTPIFAVPGASSIISPWSHFDTLITMSSCDPSITPWKEGHPGAPLPEWLTIFPPTVSKKNFNNFGLALITTANLTEPEYIFMAPHGFSSTESSIRGLSTSMKMLALMAPLKDGYSLGMKTVLGVEDALRISQFAGTRYYVRNGDFVSLRYKGIIGWSVSDVPRTMEWGVEQLSREIGEGEEIRRPELVEVDNGESFVLM